MEAAILAAVPDPLEIRPKMTLPQILELMQAADEGLKHLSLEDMELLAGKLEDKVDAYEDYIRKCKTRADELADKIKAFQLAKKTLDGRVENLKRLLAVHMRKHSFKFLRGVDWKAVLGSSKSVKPKAEAQASLYVKYADFMRISYEWDKTKLSTALKAGDALAAEVAELEENFNAKFVVNKGAVDD
jgi:hypothetical protein